MAYYNIDSADGNELTAGVSEHEIKAMAQRMANERGEAVYYYQGGTDGEDEVESVEVLPELPDDAVIFETMHDHLRGSHRAAGNWGVYPANGAKRSIMSRSDAEAEVEGDSDGYASIIRDAKRSDLRNYEVA